jgi:carbon-monoxide dehydrogenase medium subunit
VPVRASAAEDVLRGARPSPELFAAAGEAAAADLDPPADLHGSSEYRKKIAATLVRRALEEAAANANGRQ